MENAGQLGDDAMMDKTTAGFKAEFGVLVSSGVGVIMVHSRDPHRTQEVLRELAYEKNREFKVWDVVYGWRTYKDNPTDKVTADKVVDAYKALRMIGDLDNDGKEPWQKVMCVMHWPHWVLPKHPGFIQCITHYVRRFAEAQQRLVFIVPEGFSLPEELQNDVTILDFPLPSVPEIMEMLNDIILAGTSTDTANGMFTPEQRETLARNAAGLTKLEADNAFSKAVVSNSKTWPNTSFDDFNRVVLECKTDVVRRSDILELMEPVPFSDVGGIDLFKKYIHTRRHAFSDEARKFGVDVPKGFMLVGPPGTGKSLAAKATSGAIGIPLIRFDVGRVFNKYIGESESRVRAALTQLEAMAPCVALIDEVDKGLGGAHTSGGDSGVSMRVLGSILTFMQESKAPVYWVFTANRVDSLPPELLRKGRLDEVFCVTVPNVEERMEIFKIHLRKRRQDAAKISGLNDAVRLSRGFVASEIEAAVKEAVTQAFDRGVKVTGQLIIEQLSYMKPISVAFKDQFDAMRRWAEDNARLTSTEQEVMTTGTNGQGVGRPAPRRSLETK